MKLRPLSTFPALKHFFEEHKSATLLLRVAAQDYAAARCLLLNSLFEGHVLGAQAIEKFLKGYLLLNDPKRHVKKLSHSLPKILQEVRELSSVTSVRICATRRKICEELRNPLPR
jgi:hypothetical protein